MKITVGKVRDGVRKSPTRVGLGIYKSDGSASLQLIDHARVITEQSVHS